MRIEWEDVLPDGTAYRVVVPDAWNGVVLLDLDFIHPPYPAWDDTYAWIGEHGYAVAGTSRPGAPSAPRCRRTACGRCCTRSGRG